MRILQLAKDIFDQPFDGTSVKVFFQKRRKDWDMQKPNGDQAFFNFIIYYLGGRGYNEFLDYSLFAIKLKAIHAKYCYWVDGTFGEIKDAIEHLLFDDRHDLYQNLPYNLERIAELSKDNKHYSEEKFWSEIVDAVISCINVNGTEDISVTFNIPE